MEFFIAFVALIAAMVVHEAGHAYTMRKRGVEIKEMGIGIPIGKLRLTLRPRFLPFPLVLSPILLVAYVMPTEKGVETLNSLKYRDQAIISSAGVVLNIIFGVLLALAALVPIYLAEGRDMTLPAILFGIGLVVTVFYRPISYAMPLIGVLVTIWLISTMIQSLDAVGGPVMMVTMMASSQTLADAVLLGAALSLGLGLFNAMPFIPLDGGRVTNSLLMKLRLEKVAKVYQPVTLAVFACFFVFIIVKDFF